MATDIFIKMLVDNTPALRGFEQVEGSFADLQAAAGQAAQTTTQIVPVSLPRTSDAAAVSLRELSAAYMLCNRTSGIFGGQVLRTITIIRSLQRMSFVSAFSMQSFSDAIAGVGFSLKTFLTSIGPVGWAIAGVSATIAAASAAWNRYSKSVEDAKQATIEHFKATNEYYDSMKELRLELTRLTKDEYETQIEEANYTFWKRMEALSKEEVESKALLEKMRLSREEYAEKVADIEKKMEEKRKLIREIYDAAWEKAAEERRKKIEEEANKESEIRQRQLEQLKQSIKEEKELLGLSTKEITKKSLTKLGMSEWEAEDLAKLKESIEREKEQTKIAKEHSETIEELNYRLQMNNAILTGNKQLQMELMIAEKMRSGLTRQQAYEEVQLLQAIERQEEAIRNQTDAIKERNEAQQVGLEQMYKQIQASAMGGYSAATRLGMPENEVLGIMTSTRQEKSVAVLERIYTVLERINGNIKNVGVLQ
ncbi:MAG TPA: hypothetical protein P5033_10565 [Anaerohalosphaeraceae bacterium]|nr:hypothetical protein [Anaerohalosphaeraceae bacterium]